MPGILVVCYSRTGTTRAVAVALAKCLHADFEEIIEPVDRSGVLGYVRSIVDALLSRKGLIKPMRYDPAQYDVVVIGTPVWAGTMSTPVRSWLCRNRRELRRVAFFCTEHRRGEATAFKDLEKLAGKTPVARCALPGNLRAQEEQRIIGLFATRIERHLDRTREYEWMA
ncbi:hypothetical protein [Caballeronia sp. BR00000012568055]|uniref:flavodoxin family protein n=1 Tax=Caballeronia sp. BR00000012568055 TaxID=2918761 RepID=UPI0023F87D79|nr:hypothetical protein [Caballeronia sp. BR00000012568055]